MSCPPTTLVTIIATSIGTRIAPEFVTLLPTTPCTNTGRKKMAPNIDIATPTLAMFEKVKTLLAQSLRGSAYSGECISIHTEAASSTPAAEYRPTICHELHGYCTPPHTVASRVAAIPSDRVTLPQTSMACLRRSLGTCMKNQMTTSVRTAIGRLTKNSHRHEKCSVMNPPAAGPTIDARPKEAPSMPWYLPRSRGEMMSPMIACERGMMKPIPAPCTKRAKARNQKFGAVPDRAEPTAK